MQAVSLEDQVVEEVVSKELVVRESMSLEDAGRRGFGDGMVDSSVAVTVAKLAEHVFIHNLIFIASSGEAVDKREVKAVAI